jgi:hypothetical protein
MACALSLAVLGSACRSHSASILVPNSSFESPLTPYVSVNVDSWQKAPKPEWYVEEGGFLWSYNVGLFKNTPAGSADHLDNCDGAQSIWLFVVPEMALFQDYDSVDWRSPAPSHAFDASFEAGKAYQLTVGVVGTGGGMLPGATLELSLYYRDANQARVTVGALSITNTAEVFTNNTHLVDFQLTVPTVQPTDPWAGRHIGIQMLSTVDTNLQGGYWDLDNVRLASFVAPRLESPAWTNSRLQFTLRSEPGLAFEILCSDDASLPVDSWTRLGAWTNSGGATLVSDPAAEPRRRFYRARQLSW